MLMSNIYNVNIFIYVYFLLTVHVYYYYYHRLCSYRMIVLYFS